MSPELLSALRTLLVAVGAFGVGRGWFSSTELSGYADAGLTILVAVVGAWGIWAKRPSSPEAVKIAEKVADAPNNNIVRINPEPQVITPRDAP